MRDPGYFGSDGCDEPDYFELEPEPESYRFVFRDGSAIVLWPGEDPVIEPGSKRSLANEYLEWYFDFCPDDDEAKKYLIKNYR